MKALISPVSIEEAKAVLAGGADLVDVKNTREGSLGAQFPWVIQEVAALCAGSNALVSATLGDLPFKPGTAALAARGAVTAGATYIKAGLYGVKDVEEATEMMAAVVRAVRDVNSDALVVGAGYADFRRFGGLHYRDLVAAARASGCNVVMVDTAIKDGHNLFDAMSNQELKEFIDMGHADGLQVALAGSVQIQHLDLVRDLNPDIIGVRGAVCPTGDRSRGIDAKLVWAFMQSVRRSSGGYLSV